MSHGTKRSFFWAMGIGSSGADEREARKYFQTASPAELEAAEHAKLLAAIAETAPENVEPVAKWWLPSPGIIHTSVTRGTATAAA
jgi:hypothetical protein